MRGKNTVNASTLPKKRRLLMAIAYFHLFIIEEQFIMCC